MSNKASLRDKYVQQGYKAVQQTLKTLPDALGEDFSIGEWSTRVFEAIADQWGDSGFDWEEIRRHYRNEPDRLEFAIWKADILVAIGLCTTTGEAVILRFVEGAPQNDSPLKGRRLLIALDLATNYCQARGRYEIRVEPKNDHLVELYESVYGFQPKVPKKGPAYWAKKV